MKVKHAGRARNKVALGVGGVAVVAVVASYFLGGAIGLPWGGGGEGDAQPDKPLSNQPDTSKAIDPSTITRPLLIEISEHDYLVRGQKVDIAKILELAAAVPEGTGPAVMVRRRPDSRATAETKLIEALEDTSLTVGWQDPAVP